mgnify:CR=1 FL=1
MVGGGGQLTSLARDASDKPMVPVPQQMSNRTESLVAATQSPTTLYRASAPLVFTWKKDDGEMRNLSSTCVGRWVGVSRHLGKERGNRGGGT